MISLFSKPRLPDTTAPSPQTDHLPPTANKRIRAILILPMVLAFFSLIGCLTYYKYQPEVSEMKVDDANTGIRVRRLEQSYATQRQQDEFDAYFNSHANVIKPKVALKAKNKYSPVTWPQFNSEVLDVDMTSVFLTSGRAQYLKRTLASFFTKNTYPLTKVVVVNDGPSYPELDQLIKVYQNITWIITNIKVGQLVSLDQSYKHIETDYYFFSEDDFEYLKQGFIEYCLQALDYDPKLMGVVLAFSKKKDQFVMGPLNVRTVIQSPLYSGFAFWPSAHRLKDYKLLPGGYSNATFNVSYAKGVGVCESFISIQYSMKGFHTARTANFQFINHIGFGTSPVKFRPNATNLNQAWKDIEAQFQVYYKKHKDPEKVKAELSYLLEKQNKSKTNETDNQDNSTTSAPQNKVEKEQTTGNKASKSEQVGNKKKKQEQDNQISVQLDETKKKLEANLKQSETLKKKIENLENNNKQQENKIKQLEQLKKKQEELKKKSENELKKNIGELEEQNKQLSLQSQKTQEMAQKLEKLGKRNKQLESKIGQPAKLEVQSTSQEQESKAKQNELFLKMVEKDASSYRTQRNILLTLLIILVIGAISFVGWKYYTKRSVRKQEQVSGIKVVQAEQI